MTTPTERERAIANKMFTLPIQGPWADHIAQVIAEYREEILRELDRDCKYGDYSHEELFDYATDKALATQRGKP